MNKVYDGLYQVTTSYACFGLVVSGGLVVGAAPISARSMGKSGAEVLTYYKEKRGAEIHRLKEAK